MDTSLESALASWEGEGVLLHRDHPTGAWLIVALHSTRLGPAAGGTRMKPYPDLAAAVRDAERLAAGMTLKFAVAGLPYGGGKAVIALPPDFDPAPRPDLLRRYGALVASLRGLFVTGPDVGTAPPDMDLVGETGAPYVFGRTPAAGGSGDSGRPTAIGVLAGMRVTYERLFGSAVLAGRRVLVQGAGSVGGPLLALLRAEGADIRFSEVDERLIRQMRDEQGIPFVPGDAIYDADCDLFAPCALGGILRADTIPRLRCRAVVGSANNQLADETEDAARLHARGILYAPDFVVNIGGAMALLGRELLGWSEEETERRIGETVSGALREVYTLAAERDIPTDAAARALAKRRLAGEQAT